MAETPVTSLYHRINQVKADIRRVPKSGKNSHFNYFYATESDISDLVRPLMAKHGVCLVFNGPDPDRIEAIQGEKQTLYRLWVKYQLVNTDNPSEREIVIVPGEALDMQDKGYSKALTAAAKYAWLKIFDISTGDEAEDRDSDGHPGQNDKPPTARAAAGPKPRPAPPKEAELKPAATLGAVLGDDGAARLIKYLQDMGKTPEELRAALYKKGYRNAIRGKEDNPEQWPVSLTEPIKKLWEVKDAKPKAVVVDLLLNAVTKAWPKWYPPESNVKPTADYPQTPAEVVSRMRGSNEWAEIPPGLEREKQMVEDLTADLVYPDGTKIPF